MNISDVPVEKREEVLKEIDRTVELLIKTGKVEFWQMIPGERKFEENVQSNIGVILRLRAIASEKIINDRFA